MYIEGKNLKVDSEAINQIGSFVNKLANAVQKLRYPQKTNITGAQEKAFMVMVESHQSTLTALTELHANALLVLQKMDRVVFAPGSYMSHSPSKVFPDPKIVSGGAANVVHSPYAIAITLLTQVLESSFVKLNLLDTSIQVKERELKEQVANLMPQPETAQRYNNRLRNN